MQITSDQQTSFVDRRKKVDGAPGVERRQFLPTYDSARPEVNELAQAIDQYKLHHRRRFITFEELYDIVMALGYHR